MTSWLSAMNKRSVKALLSFTGCGLITYFILYRLEVGANLPKQGKNTTDMGGQLPVSTELPPFLNSNVMTKEEKVIATCMTLGLGGLRTSGRQELNTAGLNKEQGRFYINQLVACGRFNFSEVARYSLPDEWLTPMDREILKDGPVTDLTTVAVAHTSVLTRIHPTPLLATAGLRENVSVRLDLRDSAGRPVTKGGHYVRVWMQQGTLKDGRAFRAMAADITDLGNGSYVASLPVMWGGRTEVRAALHRPREFRRIMLTLRTRMKLTYQIVGAFSHGHKEQVTLCSVIPVIPGFSKVCNLTEANSGLPWYCGKPSVAGLDCGHWAWSSHAAFPQWFPVSLEENTLMRQFIVRGDTPLPKLPQSVVFTAKGPKSAIVRNTRCPPLNITASWTDQSAKGFWQGDVWYPSSGCPAPPFVAPQTTACLRNSRLLFLGDSNARQVFEQLVTSLGCTNLPDPQQRLHKNTTHVPTHCVNSVTNTSASWWPQAYPFFSGDRRWSDVRVKRAPGAVLMDELKTPAVTVGASGRYVVLIHLFIHFTPVHTAIYAQHVRHAALAVERFLTEKPDARVFVRGPHAVYGNEFRLSGDLHAEKSFAILRHAFRRLRDRVVLLNDWHMTLANINEVIHPHPSVVNTLLRTMLSHVC